MSKDNVTLGAVENCNGALSIEFHLPEFFAAAASISPDVEQRTVYQAMKDIGADDSKINESKTCATAYFLVCGTKGTEMELAKLIAPANGVNALDVVNRYVQQAKPKCL
jgi:hypothetical protein